MRLPEESALDRKSTMGEEESGSEDGAPTEAAASPQPQPGGQRPSQGPESQGDVYYLDLVADELSLARAQLSSGLSALAEAVLVRRVAQLHAQGDVALDELDAARALLAEALWRQGRHIAAGAAAGRIRPGSLERRRPVVMLIEAEALAATGQLDTATRLMERIVDEVGVDDAWRLRSGVPSRLPWPTPASLRPRRPVEQALPGTEAGTVGADPTRTAAAHARLEGSRQAYTANDLERGDRELMVALRLDPRIAPEGIALLEPTLDERSPTERLLLYGDLLRAAGRAAEASAVYDRAARA
jgi:hypothetical protein